MATFEITYSELTNEKWKIPIRMLIDPLLVFL